MNGRCSGRASSARWNAAVALSAVLAATSCSTLQQMAALRSVSFELDRVTDIRVAGVNVSGVNSPADLSLADGARVGVAIAQGELPVSFQLHVLAENPPDNAVSARLIRLQWTLFIEETETVAGVIDEEYVLEPGTPTDIPVAISLDLFDFFERTGPDLLDLALNLAGAGGAPKTIMVRGVPTIETALGPITYPQPVTIVNREVGR